MIPFTDFAAKYSLLRKGFVSDSYDMLVNPAKAEMVFALAPIFRDLAIQSASSSSPAQLEQYLALAEDFEARAKELAELGHV